MGMREFVYTRIYERGGALILSHDDDAPTAYMRVLVVQEVMAREHATYGEGFLRFETDSYAVVFPCPKSGRNDRGQTDIPVRDDPSYAKSDSFTAFLFRKEEEPAHRLSAAQAYFVQPTAFVSSQLSPSTEPIALLSSPAQRCLYAVYRWDGG